MVARSTTQTGEERAAKNDTTDRNVDSACQRRFRYSEKEIAARDIYPILIIGAGRCALTTLTHFQENRQRAALVIDSSGGWLESWADKQTRVGSLHCRYPITQTPFARNAMAIQAFSSKKGRNEELAYSGSDRFAPLPSTRLYAEACAIKIAEDQLLRSVPIVEDEVVSLEKIEGNMELYPGLLKRGGVLATTRSGKEYVAAQVVVCCAKKVPVIPKVLAEFFEANTNANNQVIMKTSDTLNVHDPEGTLKGKRLLVIGGGMTATSAACGAIENSEVASVTLLHRKNFKRREFDVEPEFFGEKGLRTFHASEDFEYRAKILDVAKERGTINGVSWKRVRSHSVVVSKKSSSSSSKDNDAVLVKEDQQKKQPKLRVVENGEVVSVTYNEETRECSVTIELTDLAKRNLAAKRLRSIIEVDADDDFQALTMTVEEAAYEQAQVETFDEIWICCGTKVAGETDTLLSSLPKTNYFAGYPQLVETELSWEHGPNEMALAKAKGGCRWPECSVFIAGTYASLHVGPVASLPMGYRIAGKEIAAVAHNAHKQSIRIRAENPYAVGLPKKSELVETIKKTDENKPQNIAAGNTNDRLPEILWRNVGIIDISKHLPRENFPRVELKTYSHEDIGFQIKIYFILPEEIKAENVKMEFLEQAFEIWAVCENAAYRVFLPKLYKTIIPERSSVKVIVKKRKIIVTLQKYDNYDWRFLKV